MVESEEDGTQKGRRLVVGIGLKLRADSDDESRADCRE